MTPAQPYSSEHRDAWNALVRGARVPHFMFEREYMEYHADRFPDASLIVFRGEQPVAVLPASRTGDVVTSHGGLTFGGLLTSPRATADKTMEALDAVLAALRATGVRQLVYKAPPHVYHDVPAEEDLYALTLAGATLTRRDLSVAVSPRMGPPPHPTRRRNARAARAAGLAVDEDDAVEEFMDVVRGNLAERHAVEPTHSTAELRLLADRFPGRIRLFVVRGAEREIIAGTVIYQTPVVAHAQYIAATEAGRRQYALDLLFEELVTERFADVRWFDFGISTTEEGRVLNEGLIRYKQNFGARAVVHDHYTLDV
ncbi:MAG TPA: GNAT family N-acetyltransferase [Solirubrobacteraceae bacterium]|nr:GNAT family N-acetyltransferase [Solirubrobacteraceae bacterium]